MSYMNTLSLDSQLVSSTITTIVLTTTTISITIDTIGVVIITEYYDDYDC